MLKLTGRFDINSSTGLSEREAVERLRAEGFNELPTDKRRSIFAIAFGVVREPMFLFLVAAGLIYMLLGDIQEALLLLAFVFVVIGITLYQEQKTERALDALRDLASPRAVVIRDGQQKRIPGREVVRGDVIVLAEGDRVPADALVRWCVNLSVDESLLTGESVSVHKVAFDGAVQPEQPGGDDLPFVYSGTLVVQGQCIVETTATGGLTEIGKIGKALDTVETESTPLQKETARIVQTVAQVGLGLCALVVVGYGLTRGNWLDGFLAGIALAMAILPEEFPVVLTIFLALGAWRISQSNVLTRRVPAVETLGAATVLASDKTGTLTQNRMAVSHLVAGETSCEIGDHTPPVLPDELHNLLEYSILASQVSPFDPMERAIRQLGSHYLASSDHLHHDWELVQEYPLSRELLAISHAWRLPGADGLIVASKGAPEAIAELCRFGADDRQALMEKVQSLAERGLRVLGVARGRLPGDTPPQSQKELKLEFLGLVGLSDPIRPTVPDAIRECATAGVRVAMITGDYPGTATSIARQIGLTPADEFITGPELDRLDDKELERRIRHTNIFARVVPEQKLRLVQALKANGEIVAMTGDGVNDAPALKSAHIGIAMGNRGTDVAREAAALVLLDDDFTSIVRAIALGRRIFDNLRKAMAYIFAVHVPIAGLSLVPILLGWPLILLPIHIVFLELLIDPACSVVFELEPAEEGVMRRPPRNPKEPLLSRRIVGLSLLQGASVLAILLVVFGVARSQGFGEAEARALTFTTLVVANLGLIFANLSWSRPILATLRQPNRALWYVSGGAVAFLGLALYVPFLRGLFMFGTLHLDDLAICLVAGLVSILWFEVFKAISKSRGAGWLSGRPAQSRPGAAEMPE